MKTQSNTDVCCVDLSQALGYPIRVFINRPQSIKPLFWRAYSGTEQVSKSCFLESPGLPLAGLLGDEFQDLPSQWLDAVRIATPVQQFAVLQAMLSSRQAQELALSAPILFVLLVDHATQNDYSEDVFQQLACSKRKQILQKLGLVASTSTLKILGRMRLQLRNQEDVQAITCVLQHPELVKQLSHVSRPSLPIFQLLQRNPQLVWTDLISMLDETSSTKEVMLLSQTVRNTHMMGASLQVLRHTKNRRQLQKLHDRMVQRSNLAMAKDQALLLVVRYGTFPSPPLSGKAAIEPLASWEELLQEGIHMQHCVGSHAEMIAAGELFIYRVSQPERLTLALRREEQSWVLDEIKGFKNTEPSPNALKVVRTWLDSASTLQQSTQASMPRTTVPAVADNERLKAVADFIKARGRCSISEIQRHFKIGYHSAVTLTRQLQEQLP